MRPCGSSFTRFLSLILVEVLLNDTLQSFSAIVHVECPTDKKIFRLAGSAIQHTQTLSPGEQAYLQGRQSVTAPLWLEFFTNGPGAGTGYQTTSLLDNIKQDWPVFGIAHSGGGNRAVLYGAGVIHSLHSSTLSSPLRGVYQLASYAAGLSGGSWLVTAMASHDGATVPEVVPQMNLDVDLITTVVSEITRFYRSLWDIVLKKSLAGFSISLPDLFGTVWSQHFLPRKTPALLMSGLLDLKSFQEFQVPLPIVVSDSEPWTGIAMNPKNLPVRGKTYVSLAAPVYEHTPFEFGSFDPHLGAFILSEYLGTSLEAGAAPTPRKTLFSFGGNSRKQCVRGFDQLSFVLGTSSSIPNAVVLEAESAWPTRYADAINHFFNLITTAVGVPEPLLAHYPNPFKGLRLSSGIINSHSNELYLVDGGENGENIPLNPLLAPARQVDVILAADASADTDSRAVHGANWPNGASMINTWLRVHRILPLGAANSPPVPVDPKIWIKHGFNTRPTFFGCNSPKKTGNGGYPLIIYLPNSPLAQTDYYTNTSTFKLQYSKGETSAFLKSVFNATVQPKLDPKKKINNWPTCFSCALIERARNRSGVRRSPACRKCFLRYCYRERVHTAA